MYHVDGVQACRGTRNVFLCAFFLLQCGLNAATLSLTGISEGSTVALTPGAAVTNLTVGITLTGFGGSPAVNLSLERQGAIVTAATANAPFSFTLTNCSAGKYFLTATVVSSTDILADVSFDVAPASVQPSNDNWSSAGVIASVGTVVTGTNTFATREAGEPNHADNASGRSLWWSWTAPVSGVVTATTRGSAIDTVMAVYTGGSLTNLVGVAAGDDAGITNKHSQVSFNALSGTTYHFAIDSAVSSNSIALTGAVQLQLLSSSPPTVTIHSLLDGGRLLIANSVTSTGITATAAMTASAGISRVEFALDGQTSSQGGTLTAPYSWNLTNLTAGEYFLTVAALDNAGLISASHSSFSVIPVSPELLFVDGKSMTPSGFQFAVTGYKGMAYELQASTNLPAWNRLVLWTNFDGALRVNDTNASQITRRFYRLLSQ